MSLDFRIKYKQLYAILALISNQLEIVVQKRNTVSSEISPVQSSVMGRTIDML